VQHRLNKVFCIRTSGMHSHRVQCYVRRKLLFVLMLSNCRYYNVQILFESNTMTILINRSFCYTWCIIYVDSESILVLWFNKHVQNKLTVSRHDKARDV
jgi:hypothetical protein